MICLTASYPNIQNYKFTPFLDVKLGPSYYGKSNRDEDADENVTGD
jgi:hypothetical protein